MAHQLFTIKKRATFVHIRDKGIFIRSRNINVQKLLNQDLDGKIGVGYTATKKIGNAVKRNKIKRRLRNIVNEAVKKISFNLNYSYLVIAKTTMLNNEYTIIKESLFTDFKKIK